LILQNQDFFFAKKPYDALATNPVTGVKLLFSQNSRRTKKTTRTAPQPADTGGGWPETRPEK